ncbi:MAG: RNA methyltransferase [Bacillota bacterium]|nr:RNA methyltransferase [Bacillota bacterium]
MTNRVAPVYIGLIHYPVYNKNMEVVTTSITNLDLHDISRSATTYNVDKYYIVHPVPVHQQVVSNVLSYWTEGYGAIYNPDRKEAFKRVVLIDTLEQAVADIKFIHGEDPVLVTTDARTYPNTVAYSWLKSEIQTNKKPIFILFGTGWGLEEKAMKAADYILEPIKGAGDYNHLSVRAAVAIILDRLLGEDWWQ